MQAHILNISLAIASLLLSGLLLPEKPDTMLTIPYRGARAARARKADIDRIRSMINAGRLSDKEALYYSPLTNAPK